MLVKMRTLSAGPSATLHPGQIYDRPEAEAKALVAGGYAEDMTPPVKAAAEEKEERQAPVPVETATIAPPETAARRRRR